MDYHKFKTLMIKGRWLWKQRKDWDVGPELAAILDKVCMGDRNMNYTLCEWWITAPNSDVYEWDVFSLWLEIGN